MLLMTLGDPQLSKRPKFKADKNKIPTAIPMISGMTFSMAKKVTSPGVAVTPEINMADKKRK